MKHTACRMTQCSFSWRFERKMYLFSLVFVSAAVIWCSFYPFFCLYQMIFFSWLASTWTSRGVLKPPHSCSVQHDCHVLCNRAGVERWGSPFMKFCHLVGRNALSVVNWVNKPCVVSNKSVKQHLRSDNSVVKDVSPMTENTPVSMTGTKATYLPFSNAW